MKHMMNPFISEQLDKINVPCEKISDTEYIFHKNDNLFNVEFEQGHYYRIEVENYIIHPYEGFTLHDNWNNGIIPTDNEMQIEVVKIMGKMMKINALGIHDGKMWSGWIPKKSARIIQVIA